MSVADLVRELQALPQHMFVRFERIEPMPEVEEFDCEVGDVRNEGQYILLKGKD